MHASTQVQCWNTVQRSALDLECLYSYHVKKFFCEHGYLQHTLPPFTTLLNRNCFQGMPNIGLVAHIYLI
jgi:hypothetical protein